MYSKTTTLRSILSVLILVIVIVVILILIKKSHYLKLRAEAAKTLTVDVIRERKAIHDDGKKQRIPKIIMQTNSESTVPVAMFATIKSILDMNPEYHYVYFDDIAVEKFLEIEYGCRIVGAYKDLIPGAYKADLFRYCFLYKYGGVYIDTGMVCIRALRELIEEDDEFVSPEDNENGVSIYNAFICCTAGHPIIAKVIRICLLNIENRDKCVEMLNVTGPGALGQAFRFHTNDESPIVPNKNYGNGTRIISHIGGRKLGNDSNNIVGEINEDGIVFMKTKYPTYYLDRVWYHKKEHYGVLWNRNEIFHSVMNGFVKEDSHCPAKILPELSDRILRPAIRYREPVKTGKRQKIPKIIMQTNETYEVPSAMFKCMKYLMQNNKEYAYFYYDSSDRRLFLEMNFNRYVLDAYDRIRPGAFKADLFRYCFLYIKGGVYIDSGMVAMRRLKYLIDENVELIVPEDDGRNRVCNGFMCAIPKHRLFKHAINRIVKNVSKHYYGNSALDITGPNLMGELFENLYGGKCIEGSSYGETVKIIRYTSSWNLTKSKCFAPGNISSNDELFFETKYKTYHLDMLWYHKQDQYDIYWHCRQLYVK